MTTGRVVTLGEAMGMVRVPDPGGFELGENAVIGTGGAEANVAVGLARLGVEVTWLGRVGDDSLGRRVRRQLRAEGVDTIAITDPAAATALMLKETPRPGRTAVQFYRTGSAGSRLTVADVDLLKVPEASWLHVTGIALGLSPSSAAAVLHAVDVAKSHGVTVSFDINHRASLWSYSAALPAYRAVLEQADVVLGGEEELSALTEVGLDPLHLARAVAGFGPREVVVKCGAQGAGAMAGPAEHWVWRDAVHAVVLDTVGAGDAFAAGYVAERLLGHPIAQALELAVCTGAAACEHPGDWEGALRRADLGLLPSDPVRR